MGGGLHVVLSIGEVRDLWWGRWGAACSLGCRHRYRVTTGVGKNL